MPYIALTDYDVEFLRNMLLETRDCAEDDAREADNSRIMIYHARMESCDSLLIKLAPPRAEDR